MNSLRMSFCGVPRSFSSGMPRFSARAAYIAMITAAGALMVKLEATLSMSRSPVKAS